MIRGIGIDIIELQRVEKLMEDKIRITEKILTQEEVAIWGQLTKRRQIEFLAGRFAAKEALSKALGTGIGAHFSFHNVSILPGENGAPTIHWNKQQDQTLSFHLSISHSEYYAVAQVIIEEKK